MDHIVLVHRHSDCYFAFIALGAAAGRLNVPPLPRARRRQALPRAAAVPCRRPAQVVPLTFVLAIDGSFVVALLEKSSCLKPSNRLIALGKEPKGSFSDRRNLR